MASVHARAPLGASNSRSKIESEHENPTQRYGPAPPHHRVHARRPAINNQPLGSRRLVRGAPRGASSPLDDPADDLAPSRLRRAADRRTPPDHTAEHSTRSQPDQAVRLPSHTEPTFINFYALLADLPLDSPPVHPKTQCTNNTGHTPNTPPHTPLKCSDSEVHIPPHPTSTTTSTAPDSTFIDSSSSKRKHSSSALASDSNHSRDRLKYRRKKKKRKNDLPQGRKSKRIQHPT